MTFAEQFAKMAAARPDLAVKLTPEQQAQADKMGAETAAMYLAEREAAAPHHFPLMTADTMAHGTGGKYYHGFTYDARLSSDKAICGARPGRRGYWGSYFGDAVTCPRCLKKLEAK